MRLQSPATTWFKEAIQLDSTSEEFSLYPLPFAGKREYQENSTFANQSPAAGRRRFLRAFAAEILFRAASPACQSILLDRDRLTARVAAGGGGKLSREG